jgi:hypothetical protein
MNERDLDLSNSVAKPGTTWVSCENLSSLLSSVYRALFSLGLKWQWREATAEVKIFGAVPPLLTRPHDLIKHMEVFTSTFI